MSDAAGADGQRVPCFELASAGEDASVLIGYEQGRHGTKVRLRAPSLDVAVDAVVAQPEFGDFFASLETDWRGWQGSRQLELRAHERSYVTSCRITATTDRLGHIVIDAEVGSPHIGPDPNWEFQTHVGEPWPTSSGAWSARLKVNLEAAELTQLARRARMLWPSDER